ncbi:MAG: 4-hydroxy-tetrahydrodipicolinate reductase [Gemmatimonadota bacterium]
MQVVLFGTGRMGMEVADIATERGHTVVARVDSDPRSREELQSMDPPAHGVAIDFSTADAVPSNARSAAEAGLDLVVGTTGWEAHRSEVEEVVRESGRGLLHAPNFSLGMLLFLRIVEEAARLADGLDEYDVHLWEAHHRHKKDHPGGTARRLADLLVERIARKNQWELSLPTHEAVDPGTLQVAVMRAGEIPGVHAVGLEGPDDRIELRHEARSRAGFARGAVMAAEWLQGRQGIFTLEDLLADRVGS